MVRLYAFHSLFLTNTTVYSSCSFSLYRTYISLSFSYTIEVYPIVSGYARFTRHCVPFTIKWKGNFKQFFFQCGLARKSNQTVEKYFLLFISSLNKSSRNVRSARVEIHRLYVFVTLRLFFFSHDVYSAMKLSDWYSSVCILWKRIRFNKKKNSVVWMF